MSPPAHPGASSREARWPSISSSLVRFTPLPRATKRPCSSAQRSTRLGKLECANAATPSRSWPARSPSCDPRPPAIMPPTSMLALVFAACITDILPFAEAAAASCGMTAPQDLGANCLVAYQAAGRALEGRIGGRANPGSSAISAPRRLRYGPPLRIGLVRGIIRA